MSSKKAKKKAETATKKAEGEIEDAAVRERIIKIIGRQKRGQDGGFIVTFIYKNLGEVRLRGKIKWQCGNDVAVMSNWIAYQRKKHEAWGDRIKKVEAEVTAKYAVGGDELDRRKEAQLERDRRQNRTRCWEGGLRRKAAGEETIGHEAYWAEVRRREAAGEETIGHEAYWAEVRRREAAGEKTIGYERWWKKGGREAYFAEKEGRRELRLPSRASMNGWRQQEKNPSGLSNRGERSGKAWIARVQVREGGTSSASAPTRILSPADALHCLALFSSPPPATVEVGDAGGTREAIASGGGVSEMHVVDQEEKESTFDVEESPSSPRRPRSQRCRKRAASGGTSAAGNGGARNAPAGVGGATAALGEGDGSGRRKRQGTAGKGKKGTGHQADKDGRLAARLMSRQSNNMYRQMEANPSGLSNAGVRSAAAFAARVALREGVGAPLRPTLSVKQSMDLLAILDPF